VSNPELMARQAQARVELWTIRILALSLFAILVLFRRERFWAPLLLVGIFTSLAFGRWYCMWICPVNCAAALPKALAVRRKSAQRKFQAPSLFQRSWFPRAWLAILCILFAACLAIGMRIRLFVWISLLGTLFSLAFPSGGWCGTLCPWSQAMGLLARLFPRSMNRRHRPRTSERI